MEYLKRYGKVIASAASIAILAGLLVFLYIKSFPMDSDVAAKRTQEQAATSTMQVSMPANYVRYTGTIYHVFFHSLVIYPQLAFTPDIRGKHFRDNMVTQQEFEKVLDDLYQNDFVLIDLDSIYSTSPDGSVVAAPIYLPKGKKPLALSIDDLNYYYSMKGRGFADKLVLDGNGDVATEVVAPNGTTSVTRDGDVVPIVDDFVKAHPDFSISGAKGTLGVTGYQGVLGYRTQSITSSSSPAAFAKRANEIAGATKVINRLKETGWKFASHSYTHEDSFVSGKISLDELKRDTQQWKDEVGSLVGPTDIYIGPFGQVFKPNDPRQQYLVSQGFKVLCGVGIDLYLHYFPDHVVMDRVDIDGIRLFENPSRIDSLFDPVSVIGAKM